MSMDKPKSLLEDAFVSETYATGADLVPCLKRIEAAIAQENRSTAVSALYIMAVMLQAPRLSDTEVQMMVWEVSKRVCTLLAGTDKPTKEAVVN